MFKKNSIRLNFLILLLILLIPFAALQAVNIINDYNEVLEHETVILESLSKSVSATTVNYIEHIWTTEDITGSFLKYERNFNKSNINASLQYILQNHKDLKGVVLHDANGNILASSEERYTNVIVSQSSYIKEMMNGRDKIVLDLINDIDNPDQYVIPITCAIRTDDYLQVIVTVFIDSQTLKNQLSTAKLYNDKNFLLKDSKGTIVYSSDTGKAPDNKDNETISINHPIPGIGWNLKTYMAYDMILASHNRNLLKNLINLIACFTFLILSGKFLLSRFLKPVGAIEATAKKIMAGDYSARTNIKSDDEIGMVAEAFDKMAESIEQRSAVRTKSFTDISHELKTPLYVIFSSVQLIESYKLSDLAPEVYSSKISAQIKLIRQNCYRFMRIINNLMDISRYDNGFLKGKFNSCDIVKLISSIALSVERYVEEKGIQLIFISETKSRDVLCDPEMIERIILNLISNSVKFTDKNGKITISIKDEKDKIIITIEDTGAGIPPDKLNYIFERFNHVEDKGNHNPDGSGIGLSLVNAFVKIHGGIISVTSEVSVGTVFHICLPVNQENQLPIHGNEPIDDIYQENNSKLVKRIRIEFSDIYTSYG